MTWFRVASDTGCLQMWYSWGGFLGRSIPPVPGFAHEPKLPDTAHASVRFKFMGQNGLCDRALVWLIDDQGGETCDGSPWQNHTSRNDKFPPSTGGGEPARDTAREPVIDPVRDTARDPIADAIFELAREIARERISFFSLRMPFFSLRSFLVLHAEFLRRWLQRGAGVEFTWRRSGGGVAEVWRRSGRGVEEV